MYTRQLNAGLEQLVAREQFQHPRQLAAIVLARVQSGLLDDFLHLAPQDGNQHRIGGVDGRSVEPEKTVLADDLARFIEQLDLDIIGVGLPVHAGAGAGLGEAQLPALLLLRRHAVQIRLQIPGTAGGAQAQHPEAARRVCRHFNLRARSLDLEILVAEKGHAIKLEPFQELHGLVAVVRVDTAAGGNRVHRLLQTGAHGSEVVHHQGHLLQDIAQAVAQLAQLVGP